MYSKTLSLKLEMIYWIELVAINLTLLSNIYQQDNFHNLSISSLSKTFLVLPSSIYI